MGISSPSLLTPPDLSLLLPLSFSFLFHPQWKEITSSSTTGEERSRRAPPPRRGSRSSETSQDLASSRRIWWDLAGFWPDLIGFVAAPPLTSPILSNLYLLIFCFVFCCGDLMIFVVGLIFYVCCGNGENPRNPLNQLDRPNLSTDG